MRLPPKEGINLSGTPEELGKSVLEALISAHDPAPFKLERGNLADLINLMQLIADASGETFATVAAFDGRGSSIEQPLPEAFQAIADDIVHWFNPSGGYVYDAPDGPRAHWSKPGPTPVNEYDLTRNFLAFYIEAQNDLGLDAETVDERIGAVQKFLMERAKPNPDQESTDENVFAQ